MHILYCAKCFSDDMVTYQPNSNSCEISCIPVYYFHLHSKKKTVGIVKTIEILFNRPSKRACYDHCDVIKKSSPRMNVFAILEVHIKKLCKCKYRRMFNTQNSLIMNIRAICRNGYLSYSIKCMIYVHR